MDENAIGQAILGCALTVHKTLGPGVLESTYEACLAHELGKAGLQYQRQLSLPLVYDGLVIATGYRLDFLVADLVVLELKAVESISPLHRAQLLGYLKLGGYRLGYLLNFNVAQMRQGIHRMANGL